MKTFWMVVVATLLSTVAFADTNCTYRNGKAYCLGEDGFKAYYTTKDGDIYSPQTGKNYYRSGNTLSGDDGSVRTKTKSGIVRHQGGPATDDDVAVDILQYDSGLDY